MTLGAQHAWSDPDLNHEVHSISASKLLYHGFVSAAGDVDMHYAISYGWSPGDNNTANAAFAEQQIDMLRPFVISTQVCAPSWADEPSCCLQLLTAT